MAGTTWNPSDKDSAITLSNGNLTAENTSGLTANKSARAVDFKNSGKFYFEVVVTAAGSGSPSLYAGLSNSSDAMSGTIAGNTSSYAYRLETGHKRTNGANTGYGASFTTGDVLGIAVDFTAGAIWFSKNGTWQASATIGEVEAGDTSHAAFTGVSANLAPSLTLNDSSTAPKLTLRSSAADITGTVPTGFTAGWPSPNIGSLSLTLPPTLAATGKVQPIHGTVSLTLPPTVSATGTVQPIHGAVTLMLPPTIAAHGTLPGKGQVALTLPMTLAATGIVGRGGTLDAQFPDGALKAQLFGYVHAAGVLEASGGTLAAELVGTVGIAGTIDASLGTLSADLVGVIPVLGTLLGTGITLGAALVGYQPVTGTLDAVLRGPRAYLVGALTDGETWHVVAMNLTTGAITEYDDRYGFNSMIAWNGAYYGADEEGIWLLAGDLDGDLEVEARARTARTDHGTEVTKRPSDVYVIGRSPKRLLFRVVVDEAGNTVYEYPVPMHLYSGIDSVKADLGRGLRQRYFQYEIANVDGADFECDGFDIVIRPEANRRKR